MMTYSLNVTPPSMVCVNQNVNFSVVLINNESDYISDAYLLTTITLPDSTTTINDERIGIVLPGEQKQLPFPFVGKIGGEYKFVFLGVSCTAVTNKCEPKLFVRSIKIAKILIDGDENPVAVFLPSDSITVSSTRSLTGGVGKTVDTLIFNNQTFNDSKGFGTFTITLPEVGGVYPVTIISQDSDNLSCSDIKTISISVADFSVNGGEDQVINYGESITIDVSDKYPGVTYSITGEGITTNNTPPVTVIPLASQYYKICAKQGTASICHFVFVAVRSLMISDSIVSVTTDVSNIYPNLPFTKDYTISLISAPSDLLSDVVETIITFGSDRFLSDLPITRNGQISVTFPFVAPSDVGSYELSMRAVLRSNPGCSDISSQIITVILSSDLPVITGLSIAPNPTCSGQGVTIVVQATGTNLKYQLTASNPSSSSFNNIGSFNVTIQQTTGYVITVTDAFGQKVSSDFTVFVDLAVDAGPNQFILPGQSVWLGVGSDTSDMIYTWISSDQNVSDIHVFPLLVSPENTTTYTVLAQRASDSDRVAQDSATVIVCKGLNTALTIDPIVYTNSTFSLLCKVDAPEEITYVDIFINFNNSDYILFSQKTNFLQTFTFSAPQSDGKYTLSSTVYVTDFHACSDQKNMTIDILPIPVLEAGSDQIIVYGTSAVIGVGSMLPNYNYRWEPVDAFITHSDSLVFPTTVSPKMKTTYIVTATPTNASQVQVATLKDSVTISVCKTSINFISIPKTAAVGTQLLIMWGVKASNDQTTHNAIITFDGVSKHYTNMSNRTSSDILIAPQSSGSHALTLTVYDINLPNCSDTRTIHMGIGSAAVFAGLIPENNQELLYFFDN